MVDEPIHDDSSYYEISITAGQAFLAVVLLIGSLAAAFAFGIIVGQARASEKPASGAKPPMILEEQGEGSRIVDVEESRPAVAEKEPEASKPRVEEPRLIEEPASRTRMSDSQPSHPSAPTSAGEDSGAPVPHVAQILSTTDKEPAENLAARLINAGYSNAYVERVPSDAGMLYRVRVRFASESEARDAIEDLRQYSPGEIWVSKVE